MPVTYEQAYGLSDNPFCPSQSFSGILPRYRQRLATGPLQLQYEDKLMPLYSDDVDSARHVMSFANLISEYGYQTDPRSLGTEPFPFIVQGPQGSGKTTLVNRMVRHLQTCGGNPDVWKLYGQWPESLPSKEAQAAKITQVGDQIMDDKPDYACVVLDDLTLGAEVDAISLFQRAIAANIVAFVFLITSDLNLIQKNWERSALGPRVYSVQPLVPDKAVLHIAQRLKFFRSNALPEPANPLFPFDEDDIRDALEEQTIRPNSAVSGIITLRQLNSTLCDALRKRKEQLPAIPLSAMPLTLATAYAASLAA